MSRPARAAQAPDTEERLARRTVSAAAGLVIGAGVAVVAPLAGPAGAASDFHEQVVVDAADADGATTRATLRGGTAYELLVEGVFASPGGEADAECTRSDGSVVWVAEDRVPSLELLVDGELQQWVPVGPSVLGCDSSSHRYRLGWTPSADGPLGLRIDGGGDHARLEGSLVVTVTGPAVVEAAPGNDPADASTEAPSEPSPPPADGSGDPATDGTAAPSADQQPPPVEVAPSVVGRSPSATSLAPNEPAAPTTPNLPDAVAARPAATVRREDLVALLLGGAAPTPPPVTVELATGMAPGAPEPPQAAASMPLLLAAALVGAAAVGLALPPRSLGRLGGWRRPSLPRRRRQPHPWRPDATRPGPARASALERSLF